MKIESYPVQLLETNELIIQDGQDHRIGLNMLRLIESLRELGFVISYPPSRLLNDIQKYLEHLQVKDFKVSTLGDKIVTIGMFLEHQNYTVSLATTDSRLNVSIRTAGGPRFSGWVESLDEFKLIWSRILYP